MNSEESTANKLIVFIPGNPSIPEVYSHFLKTLKYPVVELAHIGQNGDFNSSEDLIHLTFNFQQHSLKLKRLIQENPETQIILMGHSLGCSSILFHYQELKTYIHQYIFICPFVIPFKGNQWFTNAMGKQTINRMVKLASNQLFKSKTLTKKILKYSLGNTPQNHKILEHLSNSKYLSNFLKLLLSYQNFFKENQLIERIQDIPEAKLQLIFGKNDYWVPEEKKLKLAYQSKHITLDMGHNFCLNTNEIKVLSKYLSTVI